MQLSLANSRGFCAGVDRAIGIVRRALKAFGTPIYVRHEVVHNRFVVEDLRRLGAVFVQELDEVPSASTVVFSTPGVAASGREDARQRGLKVLDATCPLMTKVHIEGMQHGREGREKGERIFYIHLSKYLGDGGRMVPIVTQSPNLKLINVILLHSGVFRQLISQRQISQIRRFFSTRQAIDSVNQEVY